MAEFIYIHIKNYIVYNVTRMECFSTIMIYLFAQKASRQGSLL
jgi:hypothetical protein